jgi:hypothetical protein
MDIDLILLELSRIQSAYGNVKVLRVSLLRTFDNQCVVDVEIEDSFHNVAGVSGNDFVGIPKTFMLQEV